MPPKKSLTKKAPLICGNWKMYKTVDEALSFVSTLAPLISDCQARVYLAVPFTAIGPVAKLISEKSIPVKVGAQNMNDATEGAYTGEIAAKMIKEVGAEFVILGHSERRHLFHESSAFINKKVKKALQEGLEPILCIGETEEEREKGKTEEVIKSQLLESIEGISKEDLPKVVLAYEPVWAIGTGRVATPEDAELVHLYIKDILKEEFGAMAAKKVTILYGGSVKPENAQDLLKESAIDGLLVGGASLSAEKFSQIVRNS